MAASLDVTAVHDARLIELDPRTLYQILALRSAVFIVEQERAYLDPDVRDLEPATRQQRIKHERTFGQ